MFKKSINLLKKLFLFISICVQIFAFFILYAYSQNKDIKPYCFTNLPKKSDIKLCNNILEVYHKFIDFLNQNDSVILESLSWVILLSLILTYYFLVNNKTMKTNILFRFFTTLAYAISSLVVIYYVLRFLDPSSIELAQFRNIFTVVDKAGLSAKQDIWNDAYGLKMTVLYEKYKYLNFSISDLTIFRDEKIKIFLETTPKDFFLKTSNTEIIDSAEAQALKHFKLFLEEILLMNEHKKAEATKELFLLIDLLNSKTFYFFIGVFFIGVSISYGVLPGKQLFIEISHALSSLFSNQKEMTRVLDVLNTRAGYTDQIQRAQLETLDQIITVLRKLLDLIIQISASNPQITDAINAIEELIRAL